MIKKEILGADRLEHPSKNRTGCRGIIMNTSQMLIIHELKDDFYIIPGGGQEPGETLEECCIRELQEETGYIVKTCKEGAFLQLNEYYGDYHYINYYYFCDLIGRGTKCLTQVEAERRLVEEWVDWKVALDIFSHYQEYEFVNEMKMRSYLRDYTALLSTQAVNLD